MKSRPNRYSSSRHRPRSSPRGEAIRIPELSKRVDFEGEIAIVIGERCSRIAPDEDPRDYIRGYTIANDVTARDLQKRTVNGLVPRVWNFLSRGAAGHR